LSPFVALQAEEDRRLVREILIDRPDADLPETIDVVLLDGAKSLYSEVLSLLESRLKPDALIVADNADMSPTTSSACTRRGTAKCPCP
jgi:predicted O-methyltransferase YrrM